MREVTDVPVLHQLARELPLYWAEAHARSCSLLLERKIRVIAYSRTKEIRSLLMKDILGLGSPLC